MNQLATNLRAFFDEKSIYYKIVGNDEEAFIIQQKLKDTDIIVRFLVITKPEDSSVSIYAKQLCKVDTVSLPLLELLNEFNRDYRWLSFYVDKDNQVSLLVDANVTPNNIGDICMQLMGRTVNIANVLHPRLMEIVSPKDANPEK